MNCRGFSLTELMVALLLLALAGSGGLSAWAHGSAAWREARIEQQLQERAQYVFATLEPELQMAGYFGAAAPSSLPLASIPASAASCGASLIAQLDRAVEVANAYALPCAARGGGALSGSMQLVLRRVSAQVAAAAGGRAQWLASPSAGSLAWNEVLPATTPPGAERRDLLVRVYYVARNADGDAATPALRVKSLSAVAGAPAFIDTEVMPGVESLQAELLPSATAPRAVRLTLTVRADAADLHVARALRRITLTRDYALRNATAY
jgi:prepilin-type N-terminal cleavage/methylation domain-containing protein